MIPANQPRRVQADNLWYRHAPGCRCDRCERERGGRAAWRASTWSLAGLGAGFALIQLHHALTGAGGVLLMLGLR